MSLVIVAFFLFVSALNIHYNWYKVTNNDLEVEIMAVLFIVMWLVTRKRKPA
jgi:divalent metal cation (Fe/Co/Zn/Cd) transporter